MAETELRAVAALAIVAVDEIKAATDGFNRGETNVFEALDAIIIAVEAYRAAALPRRMAA